MKYRPGMFDLSDVETDAPEVVFSEPGELGFDFSDVAIPYEDLALEFSDLHLDTSTLADVPWYTEIQGE